MRRLFIDILLTLLICAILFFLLSLVVRGGTFLLFSFDKYLYQLLQSAILLFGILGITYKRLWSPAVFSRKPKIAIFLSSQVVLLFIIYQFLSINKRAIDYYNYFTKNNFISWYGKMYQQDDILGYKMFSDRRSSLVYNYLPPVPVRTDKQGFRIPDSLQSLTDVSKQVDILFLGCSFTFGSACRAENTFSYLVAADKNMNYLNAAVGGYGLAQMFLQAQQLIPRYKPKYVVVQNSPWLISRGITEFAPSRGGYLLPTPYFADKGISFEAELPIYYSSVELLFPSEDRKAFKGNFMKYYFTKGMPFFFNEQTKLLYARLKNILMLKKRPTKRITEAERFAYSGIFRIAEQNGAKVILLNLSNSPDSDKIKMLSALNRNVLIANADSVLYSFLGSPSSEDYRKTFNHWGKSGNDLIFVDGHPNPLAHQLIAKAILNQIKN